MSGPINLLSLGAGVQSSAMALMAACGEIKPMPSAAIFADTQAEPPSVYKWLDWLEAQLPFPVYRVTAGDLGADVLRPRITKDGRRYCRTNLPFYTVDNQTGERGMVRMRSCTKDFKIRPILKKARALGGIKRGQKTVGVIQWIGISHDEIMRCKPSRDAWAESRWPLIELRMTRQSCLDWMSARGYPTPPRSACVFCPFHSNAEWKRLREAEPVQFEKAVQLEKAVQFEKAVSANFKSTPYLHRSCKPLDQVDFRSEEDKGQGNLFINECEGMCGV